ncbi:MAG: hypothetical protein EOM31_05895 [Bacteroidia bacterium]|jgi:hypothetical protein|nr:hypothetical protein [Bacteroidia bacterium]
MAAIFFLIDNELGEHSRRQTSCGKGGMNKKNLCLSDFSFSIHRLLNGIYPESVDFLPRVVEILF